MATENLPSPPAQLKAIQSYLKIAQDVERVDPIVSYWLRLHSTETALKIDRESPECKTFLSALIMWLEKFKNSHKDSEAVTNQMVGQAHYENFALNLFNKADTLDRAGTANTNTVRMFFMAAILLEAAAVFNTITDDITQKAKYAKFKAAYIQKCLKSGQTPKPGPIDNTDLENLGSGANSETQDSSDPKPPQQTNQDKPADAPALNWSSTMPTSMPTPTKPSDTPTNNPEERPAVIPAAVPVAKSTLADTRFHAINGAPLKPEDIIQGQKYCKFANSALQYDDITTAVENLEKALKLLKTGHE